MASEARNVIDYETCAEAGISRRRALALAGLAAATMGFGAGPSLAEGEHAHHRSLDQEDRRAAAVAVRSSQLSLEDFRTLT